VKHMGVRVEGSTSRTDTTAGALAGDAGFVDFAVAGKEVAGEFRCADCGYGAVVYRALPSCPMCAGTVWESRGPAPPRLGD
jgi:rubrerythrin